MKKAGSVCFIMRACVGRVGYAPGFTLSTTTEKKEKGKQEDDSRKNGKRASGKRYNTVERRRGAVVARENTRGQGSGNTGERMAGS